MQRQRDISGIFRSTRFLACAAVCIGAFVLLLPQHGFSQPNAPSNSAAAASKSGGAFATVKHRNLFAELGHPDAAIRAKLNTAFQQLFHGKPDSEAVYFPAGSNSNGPLAYICDINHKDVRSEGMSYGMMIAVQLDKKAEFDALWNWSKTFMQHTGASHPARGYFAWSLKTNGVPNDEMPAPDGEEYYATALYFAAHRWGNGNGIYDYRRQADRLLTDFLHREMISGRTVSGVQTGVTLFDLKHAMVRFTPDFPNRDHTDPSYHLPAFYELWALWGPEKDREFWTRAAAVSRDYFQRAAHPETGLTPDYAEFDGSPWAAPWNRSSTNFQYDAWRCAMNWSMDWAWFEKDPRQQALSDRIQAFFANQGIENYGSRYTLAGKPLDSNHATGIVAMNAVASLAATHPRSREFVQALWKLPPPTGQLRYYDGMLYLLGLLHCSGEFRIWKPQS